MGALTEVGQFRCDEIISRRQAVERGILHYFIGTPCRHGHIDRRYVVDASCAPCKINKVKDPSRKRELDNARYADNPEKYRARTGMRRGTEKFVAAREAWDTANPTYWRDWYAANAEKQRAKARERRAAKPDVYATHGRNRRARVLAAEGFHTGADIARIRKAQKDRCAYCRTSLKAKGHGDHIVPLVRGGTNWPNNIQLLCVPCNSSKRAADPVDFAQSLGRLI